MNSKKNSYFGINAGLIAVSAAVLVVVLIVGSIIWWVATTPERGAAEVASQHHVSCIVDGKHKVYRKGQTTYTKMKTSCGDIVIKRVDSMDFSTTEAKELANQMEDGKTYDFTVVKSGSRQVAVSAIAVP